MTKARAMAIVGLVFLGIVTRLMPHPPNFNSINAMALFSAFFLGNRWLSLAIVYLTMFIGDIFVGFHSTMPFVYVTIGLIIFMGHHLKSNASLPLMTMATVSSTLLSFLIYNFGVWMVESLYPKTLSGLILCYTAALPFHLNQLMGDLAYGLIFFGYVCLANKHLVKAEATL